MIIKRFGVKGFKINCRIRYSSPLFKFRWNSFGLRTENGREAAILLKEVMDRIAILDPLTIPEKMMIQMSTYKMDFLKRLKFL